ncbi:helix-turn-helix domain-containing protein [Streptosporangium sp. NPDC048047]|uniref:TetR/AcrR family transcriptional regulator n=1 Tax=Streptosporangium sp. NPDC048047 TaxID=3155748 RepID=UPI003441C27B
MERLVLKDMTAQTRPHDGSPGEPSGDTHGPPGDSRNGPGDGPGDGAGARPRRPGRPPRDAARHLERAHRILDTACDLVLDRGYDATTVGDIARRAGVAKGTIYLHWRTREELFAALLRRERAEMAADVRKSVEDTPGRLRDLLGLLAAGLLRRPLLRASLLGDSEVLGGLTRAKRDGPADAELRAGLGPYLAELTRRGALRADLTPAEHVTALSSILYGFLTIPRLLPGPYVPDDERLAELVADACGRTLESGTAPTGDDAREIRQATLRHIDFVLESARRKLSLSLGTKETPR